MDRNQFITLVESEQAQLRRYLLALCCGDRDEADDIAQDALVKAYLSSAGFDNVERFTAWIYTIAYRTFIDYRRGSRQQRTLDECRSVADPSQQADGAFCYQELYAALDQLPPRERGAVLLYYIKGYSVKEIAQIVDGSDDAVRQQLSRGRKHLKEIMTL